MKTILWLIGVAIVFVAVCVFVNHVTVHFENLGWCKWWHRFGLVIAFFVQGVLVAIVIDIKTRNECFNMYCKKPCS